MSDWTCWFDAVNWTGSMLLVAALMVVGYLLGPVWFLVIPVGIVGLLLNLAVGREA